MKKIAVKIFICLRKIHECSKLMWKCVCTRICCHLCSEICEFIH